jgi:hypothetical protein
MPKAHITHHIEGRRLRIRVPHKRFDHAFFREIERRINTIDGVKAEVNPDAASVLVRYAGPSTALLEKLVDAGLDKVLDFELGPIGEVASDMLPLPIKLTLVAGLVAFGYRLFDL